MMISDVLRQARRNKRRKRVGRGIGSGHGKTSCRGSKGSGQHSAPWRGILAEGGQMPLFRRIPKRGFNNAQFRVAYQVVNVSDLEKTFDNGAKVTPVTLEEAGLIASARCPVKILGNGEITKKLDVEAARFSASATEKITKAGGKVQTIA